MSAALTIRAAAAKWNSAKFSFRIADDMACSSDEAFPVPNGVNQIDFGPTERDAPGTARPYFTADDLLECDIRFHAEIPNEFVWNLNSAQQPGEQQWDLFTVALHEFGHCLGLNDSLEKTNSAMYTYLSAGQRRALSADDLAGRDAIYGR